MRDKGVKMKTKSFVGTWRLVSCELRTGEGQVSYPFGKDAVGYIMYNEDGYMSVVIMSTNRPKFTSGDLLKGTTEEKVAAAETYVSYCGRYDVKDEKVVHHIEISFFPNWIGVQQERLYMFEENQLTLSTLPMLLDGQVQSAHLIWERV